MNIPYYMEAELQEIARKLILNFENLNVWCFYAEIGSGKTTLIKEIGKELLVVDKVSSPTFSIINEYESKKKGIIYHFDCYRLKSIEEAIDIGVEDYLYSGELCLIEWPGLIVPLLPEDYLKININLVSDKARSLTAIPE
ncbi:MAG: tRNA (adenosine(37)-N6)-threonylcarbamoyltransferase complex ATPase subunit type 1 TsaE [Ekhidna sp.]|nr:tRNA (adenosine(37)-N6)-threonylcarbamoyltransferase complex ATPase subunit type 1 TsaE [Ekhidna sp.]